MSFCSSFSFTELFVGASNLSSSTAAGPDKAAYPMLKHFFRSGMDLFLIFNLFWSLHSFPSIWKTSSIIPIHKMESLLTLVLPSDLPLSPQSYLNASLYLLYYFLEFNSILYLPAKPVSSRTVYPRSNFAFFSVHFKWVHLINPGRAL